MLECFIKKDTPSKGRAVVLPAQLNNVISKSDNSYNCSADGLKTPKVKYLMGWTVGGVFLLLILTGMWFRLVKDNLIQYAPDNTVLYAHFSLPKLSRVEIFNKTISKALAVRGIAELPVSMINREISVVGQIQDDNFKLSVLIKTNDPIKLRKYLDEKRIAYEYLSSSVVLIPADDNVKNDFVLNKGNQVVLNTKGQFSFFNSVDLFIHSNLVAFLQNDLVIQSLYGTLARDNGNSLYSPLALDNGHIYLNAQAKFNRVKIFNHQKFPFLFRDDDRNMMAQDFDLAFSGNGLKDTFSNWENLIPSNGTGDKNFYNQLKTRFLINYLPVDALDDILDKQMVFLTRANENQTDWFFADNDFYLSIEEYADSEEVEETIKKIIAHRFPTERVVRLSDGFQITELVPDISGLGFEGQDGYKYLDTPDQSQRFFYQYIDTRMIITNNNALLTIDEGKNQLSDNFIKIKNSYLPKISLLDLLVFDVLEVDNGVLFLK